MTPLMCGSGERRQATMGRGCKATLKLLLFAAAPFLPAVLALPVAAQEARVTSSAGSRRVVLFVLDSLGPTGREGALAAPFAWEGFPVSGEVVGVPPDPAAAGTALACGVEARPGSLSLDTEGHEVQSVLEAAQAAGLATGLVTFASPTDPLAAAFRSHVQDSTRRDEIIWDLLAPPLVDVIFAGGMETDQMAVFDALGIAMAVGYRPIWFPGDLPRAIPGVPHYAVFDFNSDGRLSPPEPPAEFLRDRPELETRTEGERVDPHLWQMAEGALRIVEGDPEGFFLVLVSQTGAAGGASEVAEMDRAVRSICGWLSERGQIDTALLVLVAFGSGEGNMVWARGPGADRLGGEVRLEDICRQIRTTLADPGEAHP